ncbi:hypothetical protein LBMAG52_28710 [Planctomycetia bacterium]|nr:hypothetical protein LBMAG52_28710 [Planctomycetia bacterium]
MTPDPNELFDGGMAVDFRDVPHPAPLPKAEVTGKANGYAYSGKNRFQFS